MATLALKIDPHDDVMVALRDLKQGQKVSVNGQTVVLSDNIEIKHQFATRDLAVDDQVRMHGVIVGRVVKPIACGGALTTENLTHATAKYGAQRSTRTWTAPPIDRWDGATFDGYVRSDGSVGTANHWLVIPMVCCQTHNLNNSCRHCAHRPLPSCRHSVDDRHADRRYRENGRPDHRADRSRFSASAVDNQ